MKIFYKAFVRQVLFAATLQCLFSLNLFSQYVINKPYYASKESNEITVDAIRVFPDSLILDLRYYGSRAFDNPGFYVNSTSKIVFSNGGNWLYADWKSRVSKLVNAHYSNITNVKKGSYHSFSVVFPFSLYKILGGEHGITEDALEFFDVKEPLQINFVNCDKSYRQQYSLNWGSCFDITQLKLDLPVEHWASLWCSSFLNKFLQKDEFETTAKYRSRISPDTIRKQIKEQADLVHSYFGYLFWTKMQSQTAKILYNSDNETFDIEYLGAEKMTFAMSLATAPAFKQKVVSGELEIYDVEPTLLPSGKFYIESIVFKNKYTDKKTVVENKKGTSYTSRDFDDKVLQEVRKNYTQYTGF